MNGLEALKQTFLIRKEEAEKALAEADDFGFFESRRIKQRARRMFEEAETVLTEIKHIELTLKMKELVLSRVRPNKNK